MAASTTLQNLVVTATTLALAVATAAKEETFSTRQEAEGAANAAREAIDAAIAQALADEPIRSQPLVRRLRDLAARLLDLGEGLKEALQAIDITLGAERSAIDLALQRYGDGLRADEIVALNRTLKNPLRIPAGAEVTLYAR